MGDSLRPPLRPFPSSTPSSQWPDCMQIMQIIKGPIRLNIGLNSSCIGKRYVRGLLWYLELTDDACAGLDSITQVFSVISSCIVDVSVGRCAWTPPELSCAL